MKKGARETGQATIELAVMLLGIAAMILALLVLADVQFTGNTLVLDARYKAQQRSHDSDPGALESGNEYASQEQGTIRLQRRGRAAENTEEPALLFRDKRRHYYLDAVRDGDGRRITEVSVPFAVGAETSRNHDQSSIAPAYAGLSGANYSANTGSRENFRSWRTLSNFSGAASDADFSGTVAVQNALNAASLVRTTGSVEGRLLNSRQAEGAHSAGDALWQMKHTFTALFGGDPDRFNPPDDPANQAVMPLSPR